jgi:hypothetical protein
MSANDPLGGHRLGRSLCQTDLTIFRGKVLQPLCELRDFLVTI